MQGTLLQHLQFSHPQPKKCLFSVSKPLLGAARAAQSRGSPGRIWEILVTSFLGHSPGDLELFLHTPASTEVLQLQDLFSPAFGRCLARFCCRGSKAKANQAPSMCQPLAVEQRKKCCVRFPLPKEVEIRSKKRI